jgi:hypothetical protein
MATKRSSGPKTVTLLDKDGNKYESSSPAEINNLVYGQGYVPADSKSPLAEQVAALLDSGAAVTPAEPTPTPPASKTA